MEHSLLSNLQRLPLLSSTKPEEHPFSPIFSHKEDKFSTISAHMLRTKKPVSKRAIFKDYSKALINFALSSLAFPYLNIQIEEQAISIETFKEILSDKKEKKASLRSMLLAEEDDSLEITAFKLAFKNICKAFLEVYFLNWILKENSHERIAYFRFRSKMMRKIQHPERLRV